MLGLHKHEYLFCLHSTLHNLINKKLKGENKVALCLEKKEAVIFHKLNSDKTVKEWCLFGIGAILCHRQII